MGKVFRFLGRLWILVVLLVLSVGIALGFRFMAGGNQPGSLSLAPAGSTNAAAVASAVPTRSPGPPAPYPYPGPSNLPTVPPRPTATATPTGSAAILTPIPMPPSTYISKEVVAASRGSGSGQIGIDELGGDARGPQSFTTDASGNIYILDWLNQRVNKYDAGGRFQSNLGYDASIFPSAIYVLGDSNITFLADTRSHRDSSSGNDYLAVHKIDPSGKTLLTYKWYGVSEILDLRVDGSGAVWAWGLNGAQMDVARLGNLDRPFDAQEVAQNEKRGYLTREGNAVALQGNTRLQGYGYVVAVSGGHQLYLPVPRLDDARFTEFSVLLLNSDVRGNIYLDLCYETATGQQECHVLVYNQNGSLVDQAAIPVLPDYARTERTVYVDDQGRIYRMTTTRDGMKVFRWEKAN